MEAHLQLLVRRRADHGSRGIDQHLYYDGLRSNYMVGQGGGTLRLFMANQAGAQEVAIETYGAGAEISALIGEELLYDLDAPVVRIGGPDVPAMGFAGPLEHFFMPDAEKIYERMKELAHSCRCRHVVRQPADRLGVDAGA